MELDRDRIRFKGKVGSAAIRKNASVDDPEAKIFVDQLYKEWKAMNKPIEEADSWLDKRLDGIFLSLKQGPVWVEAEPTWPFMDGKPMVFLSQVRMDDSAFSKTALSPKETAYLFAGRQPAGKDGFKLVYRVVSQFED